MNLIERRHNRHAPSAGAATALVALTPAAMGSEPASAAPRATIDGRVGRGAPVPAGDAFRGLPYAAAPVGNLRWRAPRPPAARRGVRDAAEFGPSCPQAPSPFAPPGPQSEDCLYLNVVTPTLRRRAGLPVLVWIHGGGLTEDAARKYDGSERRRAARVDRNGARRRPVRPLADPQRHQPQDQPCCVSILVRKDQPWTSRRRFS